jgi:hypothetical protein
MVVPCCLFEWVLAINVIRSSDADICLLRLDLTFLCVRWSGSIAFLGGDARNNIENVVVELV